MARLVMDGRLLSPQLVRQRLQLAAWAPDASAQRALLSGYERWCEQKGRRGDCLLLGGTLGPEERRSLALSLALESGSVWSGASDAVKRMVDPLLLQAMVATFMAAYMAMLLLPEPVSKAVAVALTVYLVSWLGWSTLRSIIGGWRQLTREAEGARTFAELSAAGERFGRIMGEQSARVFVMLVTAALGQTAGLVAKGPSLPGYAQAALLAESQGLRLGAVGQVSAVAVVDEQLIISLGSSAAAMSSRPEEPSDLNAPKIHEGKQGKHIPGHNNFQPGKSELTYPEPQRLLERFIGKGVRYSNKEVVDFGEEIGTYVGPDGVRVPTTRGTIHFDSKGGAHIVPAAPQ